MAELSASQTSGSRNSLKKLAIRVDLTAMVDLAFLLITFFMLATSLSKPRAMPLVMPAKGPPGKVAASTTLTICLGSNNRVLWYRGMAGKPLSTPQIIDYSKNGLRRTLVEISKDIFKATGKPMMVLIKPSSHSVYANMVAAMDELNISSVQSYAIADIAATDIDLLKAHNAF